MYGKHPFIYKFFFNNVENPDYLIFVVDIKTVTPLTEDSKRIAEEMKKY